MPLTRLFSASPILVVGDIILDEYLIGRATRLSREAAVPVLERTRRHLLLGGAANPALGVARLGGRATMAGVVGADPSATEVWRMLAETGIAASAVVTDETRPTTLKTRIVAEGTLTYLQHLARIDVLDRSPLAEAVVEVLLERIHACLPAQQAVLLSHYGNGVLSEAVVAAVRAAAQAASPSVPLLVDAQSDFDRFAGFDVVRCNRHEAGAALGAELPRGPEGRTRRYEALLRLRDRLEAGAVVVTMGSEGIAWLDEEGYGEEPAANRSEVFDVTGAGDTVIAVLAMARAAGLSLAEACHLANVAAGLVVRVAGNYAPTAEELEAALADLSPTPRPPSPLLRREGRGQVIRGMGQNEYNPGGLEHE